MGDREYSDAQRERYLKSLNANGRIPTDSGKYLADEIGAMLMVVDVRVDYVSAPVGDVVYATIATPDGTGKALVILDAQDHAEACGWMAMETVTLAGEARLLFEQPAIDLRRARPDNQAPAGTAHKEHEQIESGEWSAAAVAHNYPGLYADVTDMLMLLDPVKIADLVLRDRQADLADVSQALDDLIPYPYAEDEVPLPHDQTHMDALTTEVEKHLKDGDL